MRRRSAWPGLVLAGAIGCSTESKSPASSNGGSGGQTGTALAGTRECTAEALDLPAASSTYHVAAGEPGADDVACDGLAPTDEGGGRCPFASLDGPRVRALLAGSAGVRVELGGGTYVIAGWDGLLLNGTGTSEAERTVLTSRPGQKAVLDVGAPDGTGCTTTTAPTDPLCVRQVVRVTGTYAVVQGLTIQNGLAYDLEVQGAHQLIRCNTFTYTADFTQRSDSLKVSGQTTDVEIRNNVFTGWHSQAVDITQASAVLVEGNEFFAPHDPDGGATGTKFGARDVTIRGNDIHDLGTDPRAHVFSLGGTGAPHPDDFEAFGVHVIGNRVRDVPGILAQVVSCDGCSVEDNRVSGAAAGILISAAAEALPECSTSATGCRASEGTRITGNRLRGLDGAGDPASANVFVFVEAGQGSGLLAGSNVYCAPSAGAHRFGVDQSIVGFAEWVSLIGTDQTSSAVVETDALCTF